jgi:predicted RNA binding protein YcfA (HicA-like mRNA interferase family)
MNKKVYEAVKSGQSDNNIKFADLQNLILDLGFTFIRQRGTSHAIYYNDIIKEKLNIQPDGNKAKNYQVKQLRDIIRKHNL